MSVLRHVRLLRKLQDFFRRSILERRRTFHSAAHRKPAGTDRLGEVLIEVGIQALEGGGVEPVADDAGVAENVSACVQFLGVQP